MTHAITIPAKVDQALSRLGMGCHARIEAERGFFDGSETRAKHDAAERTVCEDVELLGNFIRSLLRENAALKAAADGEAFDEEATMDPLDVLAAREGDEVDVLLDASDEDIVRRAKRHAMEPKALLEHRTKRKASCSPCAAAAAAAKEGA